jgi:hypothetical protein
MDVLLILFFILFMFVLSIKIQQIEERLDKLEEKINK